MVFGCGGTAVEVIADKALALPPLDLALARDLIARTRVSRVLRAYRNVPAADIDAVALLMVKLAQLAADMPELRDSISTRARRPGGIIAVDARVLVAPLNPRGADRPAIPASPSGLPQAMGAIGDNAGRNEVLDARSDRRMSRCTDRSLPRSRRKTCVCASSRRSRSSATASSRASPRSTIPGHGLHRYRGSDG